MKRLFALVVTVALLGGIMSGCGNTTDKSQLPASNSQTSGSETPQETKPVTITIWHETSEDIANSIQAELDKLAPDVVVKVERKEKMSDALKLVGNDPNSAPDMYFFAHDKIGVFAQMGVLSPITDFISQEKMSDLMPMALTAATYQDEIYQLPVYFETQMFMYNKALMKEVPKTTDDLLAYMIANTKDGNYGFVEQHSTAYYSSSWMHAFGGFIINENAEPGLDNQATVDSVTYHKQFVPYMPIDGEYNTITTLFKEGKAHAIIGGPWLVPEVRAAGIDLGIAPMPTVNATGKPLTPYSGVQGISVLKANSEEKKDAITKVIEQLLKPDIGIALAKSASCAPVNNNCYEDAAVAGDEMIVAMKEVAANVVPMPNVPEMDVMWTVTENMLAAVNKNGADAQSECAKAQKDALNQIAAMK
ncbi:MAG: extracellular solute-binding protein family 1 [Anaerocolumna sp.]|jgi:arabinogalactan oligomer/maltooligosaccharide transport system substrate-binding protein|nr:extracellular solute-binding protein family 1 [Anaerocolumna sp.]